MLGERLKKLRKEHRLNQTELGTIFGLSASTIGMYEQGRRDPDSETLAQLADYFDVTVDYLLGLSNDRNKTSHTSNSTYENIVSLPIIGHISAGTPVLAIENIEDYEFVSRNTLNPSHEYFFLRVNGDSMNIKMQNGDRVLVQRQEHIENGEIAIVMVNGEDATIKKIYINDHIVTLIPLSTNPEHTPQTYDTRETPVKIIGKAVQVTSNL